MSETRLGIVMIPSDLLEDMLRLPAGTVVAGGEWDYRTNSLNLQVKHEDFREHAPGSCVMRYTFSTKWNV